MSISKYTELLKKEKRSRLDTDDIQVLLNIIDYIEFANIINQLEENKILSPVKASKLNGKKPRLYNRYSIIKEKEDYRKYIEEMKYKLNYKLNLDKYIKNPKRYLEDRNEIMKLSLYFDNNEDRLKNIMSMNERSCEIWGNEKYLRSKGISLLGRLGLDVNDLNIYDTYEPISYVSFSRKTPQTILIIENKDTYNTFVKYMEDNEIFNILGIQIDTVIYGRGKGVWSLINAIKISSGKYILNTNNSFIYFGDIDYEGIYIYEKLKDSLSEYGYRINLFKEAYKYLIDKKEFMNLELPHTKEKQNKNIKEIFLEEFDENYRKKVLSILESGKYIAQEHLNYNDLMNNFN